MEDKHATVDLKYLNVKVYESLQIDEKDNDYNRR